MTCIVACKSRDGVALLAADSCISWRFNQPGQTVYQDELQKLYGIHAGATVAVCGDLRPAQTLLAECRKFLSSSIPRSPREASALCRRLPRLLRTIWQNQQLAGHVILGVIVGGENVPGRAFVWSSSQPSRMDEVRPEHAIVRGSIRFKQDLANQVENGLSSVCRMHKDAPISPETFAALVANKLSHLLVNDEGRSCGVGGIFQICTSDEKHGPYVHGFDAASFENGDVAYQIALRIESDGTLVQRNEISRQEVPLVRLDAWNFDEVPKKPNLFTYGQANIDNGAHD